MKKCDYCKYSYPYTDKATSAKADTTCVYYKVHAGSTPSERMEACEVAIDRMLSCERTVIKINTNKKRH